MAKKESKIDPNLCSVTEYASEFEQIQAQLIKENRERKLNEEFIRMAELDDVLHNLNVLAYLADKQKIDSMRFNQMKAVLTEVTKWFTAKSQIKVNTDMVTVFELKELA